MSFGDFMAMVVAMSGLVGIVAILGQAYRRRLEHKERIAELRVTGPAPLNGLPAPDQTQLVERLEARIRVLERIATDKTAKLSAEIEDLREPVN